MQLRADDIQVDTFEVQPAPGPDTPAPQTAEPQYHSLCYICYETDRTMCRDTCNEICIQLEPPAIIV